MLKIPKQLHFSNNKKYVRISLLIKIFPEINVERVKWKSPIK